MNTPNMLSTPLSVMAALVLGEFSVNSGWFSAEVIPAQQPVFQIFPVKGYQRIDIALVGHGSVAAN